MMVNVKHRNSDYRWNNKVWIDYWKKNNDKSVPSICPCCNMAMDKNGGAVGAHVVKENEPNGEVYITPTCDICNKKYKGANTSSVVFLVDENMLVPANEAKLNKESNYYDDDISGLRAFLEN